MDCVFSGGIEFPHCARNYGTSHCGVNCLWFFVYTYTIYFYPFKKIKWLLLYFFLTTLKKALNYPDLRKSLCWWNKWFKNTNNSSFLPLKLSVKKSQNTGNSLLLKRKILNAGNWNTIKLLTKSLTLFGYMRMVKK